MLIQQLNIEKLSFETDIAKTCALIFWVQKYIEVKPSNIIPTINLFQFYEKDITRIYNACLVLPEKNFYKQLQNALLTNKIIFGRIRYEGQRSYSGIRYKCENL